MKIAIDLGHGVGSDRGAVGIISEESVINAVGALVINKLQKMNHTVINVRPDRVTSVSDSLYQRVYLSNSMNVDLFVSIHANVTKGGYGSEIFTYGAKPIKEAVNVLDNLHALGFKNRGIKDSRNVAYVVNHTNAKAMLIEIMFVDSQGDVDIYNRVGAKGIADAIVKGIVGSTVETTETPSTPVQSSNNMSTNLRDWQRAYNNSYGSKISVDGLYGPQTESVTYNAILKQGSRNALVAWLQCRINCEIDGIFGSQTRTALITYQINHGLTGDGVAGHNTWLSLFKKFYW